MDFTYDPALVILSIAVAMLGSFTGLVMTAGIRHVYGLEANLRIALGSIGIGGGIWAMHFIAMLAVILPIGLQYDLTLTTLSAIIAVTFSSIAFIIVRQNRFGHYSIAISAIFLGLGIATMHYVGMNAIQGNCVLRYSWIGVILSVLIAVQASAVALWFAFRERGLADTLLGAVALGLAISSMHYVAMEATEFMAVESRHPSAPAGDANHHLALTISLVLYGICGVSIFVFAILTHMRRMAQRSQRRLINKSA